MKVTKWTYFGNCYSVISCWNLLHTDSIDVSIADSLYKNARQAVIEDIRNNNYHFSGEYHQNGDFGCPIIDDEYSFEVSQREWGSIMADAYPDEDYTIYDERTADLNKPFGSFRYLKWAFTSDGNEVITPYTQYVKVSDNFSYTEKKSPFEEDIIIYNSDGCSWCDGTGTNPDGIWCGECTNICKEYCYARKRESQECNK